LRTPGGIVSALLTLALLGVVVAFAAAYIPWVVG
jgi:hypothetical protein